MKRARDAADPPPPPRAALAAYPWPSDYSDHFETSPAAYADIARGLDCVAKKLGKSRAELVIYDPYYCAGAMKAHLAALGFAAVLNEKTDCYAVWARGQTPAFDVLVTNPPFSDDNKKKALAFALAQRAPFFLLLPTYTITKAWFREAAAAAAPGRLLYAVPSAAYAYAHPEGTGAAAAPFASLWVASGSAALPTLLGQWRHGLQGAAAGRALALVGSAAEAALAARLPTEKRKNPRQRKRLAARLGGGGGAGT